MASLVVMGLIAIFLFVKAWPAMHQAGWHFFTRFQWDPDGAPALYGVASAVYGTVVIAVIALVVALPISIGTALYINEYAPRRAQRILVSLVDLLAAIPSVVFGLWGRDVLNKPLSDISAFLYKYFRFVPIFHTKALFFGNSFFVCGIVLALMIVPIISTGIRLIVGRRRLIIGAVVIILVVIIARFIFFLLGQQGLAISDGDLIIIRMNFCKRQKAMAVAAIFNKGRLQ